MASIDGRKMIESPEGLEKISVCVRDGFRIDHPIAVPAIGSGGPSSPKTAMENEKRRNCERWTEVA